MPKYQKTQSCPKTLYRVSNWPEYDQALVQRGAITIVLMMKTVFHMPNRATEGFACSIFALPGMRLPVPDHTTLSRRGKDLETVLPKTARRHMDLVMDNTGLKTYGKANGR